MNNSRTDCDGCSFCPLTLDQIITTGPNSSFSYCYLFILGQTPVAHITYAVHARVLVGTKQLVCRQSCAEVRKSTWMPLDVLVCVVPGIWRRCLILA